MDRLFENNLREWKNNMTKPLMFIGVRQIGKTYTISKTEIPLKVFADEYYFKLYLIDIGMLVCLSEVNFLDIVKYVGNILDYSLHIWKVIIK